MHQIRTTIAAMDVALKDAVDANPVFLPTGEKAAALLSLLSLEARLHELTLRVFAQCQDVADETGARDAATWVVAQEVADSRVARRDLELARALETHEGVRAGLADGRFGAEHARVIIRALEELPEDLPAGVAQSAEEHLCDLAGRHRPADLRHLGHHLLEVVAPEIAERAEAQAIARLETQAEAKATLSITSVGDGTSRIFALVPEAVGERLRTYLEAFAQPRIAALDAEGRVRPRSRVMADALGQLLETIDPKYLPAHGGDATTVVITMTLDQLHSELGVATMADGTPITASQARRLACTAGILPVVLGGRSEPLDLGRTRRLYAGAQRKAMRIRDQHCRAEGCTVPAAWCDSHHLNQWSHGGRTDLADGVLLCGHHHRRAHDPTYHTTRLPGGDYRFRRKTRVLQR